MSSQTGPSVRANTAGVRRSDNSEQVSLLAAVHNITQRPDSAGTTSYTFSLILLLTAGHYFIRSQVSKLYIHVYLNFCFIKY